MAIDQGDAAANWINKFLEKDRGSKEFRLFRVKDSFKRQTDPKYAPHSETGMKTSWECRLISLKSRYFVQCLQMDSRIF